MNKSEKPRRALIAGCGYIGKKLAEDLSRKGWEVDGLSRSQSADQTYFRTVVQDLSRPFTLADSYDVVFYLVSADCYEEEAYDLAYRRGLQNLLQAVVEHTRTSRLIFVSSTSVYAQGDGTWVDETSPCSHDGFARQALLGGEQLALQSGLPAMVVRFSGIYGPGRMRFRDSVLKGETGLVYPSFFTNRIHRDDGAAALVHLMEKGIPGEIYLVTDAEPADYNDVIRWICSEAGREALPGVGVSPSHHRGNKRCSSRKLLDTGFTFIHPNFRSGYAFSLGEPAAQFPLAPPC
ncbi:MAG: SDR family oxidoreductase [Oligoflexales bacterium]|nr:SDR family oxidoreductase [Oligoflexales bacterium]